MINIMGPVPGTFGQISHTFPWMLKRCASMNETKHFQILDE